MSSHVGIAPMFHGIVLPGPGLSRAKIRHADFRANSSSMFSHPSSNNLQIFLYVSFIWIFSNVRIQNCRKNMKESSRLIFPFGAHGGCACQGFPGLGVSERSGQISARGVATSVYKLINDWCQLNH